MRRHVATVAVLALLLVQTSSAQMIRGSSGATDVPIRTNESGFLMPPNNWNIGLNPAVNTQATATQAAAGAGLINVADCISATFAGGTTAPAAVVGTLVIRDGATGTGTVIFSANMPLAGTIAASTPPIQQCRMGIPGSVNTAMTVEFTAAGGANTFESVRLTGYVRRP